MYSLEFHRKAKKELDKFSFDIKLFIVQELGEFIKNFSDEYEDSLIKRGKIKHLKGEYSGYYRLKLRTYRVIYEKIDNKLIIHVLRIAHRKEVY